MAASGLSAARRGGDPDRRRCSLYNLVSTGQLIQPGYQYLYELEASFYTNLGYHLDWSIEDPRYIPQNLWIMLFNTPAILPDVFPAGLGDGQAAVHASRARSAACSTPTARSPCRATPG